MRVLITGKDSYIGLNIRSCLEKHNYSVDEADMLTDAWKDYDFSNYETVIHVAAVVHENAKSSDWEKFKKVNVQLVKDVVAKAKAEGVKQFIFFSTMAVYGQDKKLPKGNVINKDTPILPTSMYGKSKYMAEQILEDLADDNFKVAVLRPPNVYGKNCPGNYIAAFRTITKKLPFFPYAYSNSKQSFIYIENLSNLVRLIIENKSCGIFMPQDDFIPNTNDLLEMIAKATNNKIRFSKFLGFFVRIFRFVPLVNKLYGGVSYDECMSDSFDCKYRVVSFEEGIKKTFEDEV